MLYTYQAGTNIPLATYKDAGSVSPNTNPIVLDGRGECVAFWQGSYKVVLTDADGVVIWTQDNLASSPADDLREDLANDTDPNLGAGMVGFGVLDYPDGTIGWALNQVQVNVKWFGAVGDGVADDTAAIQAAINFAGIGRQVFVPKGRYKITATLVLAQSQKLVGETTLAAFKSNLQLQLSTIDVYVGQGGTTQPAILLDLGSGVEGICFNHPNQVAETAAAPIQFGWTIATDTSKPYFIDDVTIRDVMFVNSYMGLSLDKSGRFYVDGVYGDCIKEGVFVDRCFDVGRMSHVHIWTFTYTPASNMMTWISLNGRAFNLCRADGTVLFDCFQYGRFIGFDFNDNGNGGFWGDLVSCFSDVAHLPLSINKVARVKWIGGGLIPYLPSEPCVTTSTDISNVGQGPGFVCFVGTQFHDIARVGAVITSTTGNFNFTDCDFERAEVTVINASTAKVSVDSPKTRFGADVRLTVIGDGANTKYNGVPNPACSTDVSPANFNMQVFAAGLPTNWALTTGVVGNLADQGGGFVRLKFVSAAASTLSYTLPAAIRERRSLYTLRVLVRYANVTDGILTFYSRRADMTNLQSFRRFNSFNHGASVFYNIPLIVGYETAAQSIDIEWSSPTGTGASTGYVEIAGIQLFECADGAMWQDVIDSTYRREYNDPFGYGPAIAKAGGPRTVQQAIAPPTAGTWRVNDRVLRYPQVVGQPKAWACTVAGSPGTWVSEGNL